MRFGLYSLITFTTVASAQIATFGIQGGVPAQTPMGQTTTIPFAIGPSVDLHLFSGLSLETGALFRRLGDGQENSAFFYPANSLTLTYGTSHGEAVELPFLAKYRFRSPSQRVRPFLVAGPAVRRTSVSGSFGSTVFSSSGENAVGGPYLETKRTQWNVDPVGGAGVDIRTGRFHLEPSIRYSYWSAGENSSIRKNQVEFLIGLRFQPSR